jgi:hypothetical protein
MALTSLAEDAAGTQFRDCLARIINPCESVKAGPAVALQHLTSVVVATLKIR